MSTPEKLYALFAIVFELGLVAFFLFLPQYRELSILLPASAVGLAVNTFLLFVIFRDIWLRPFPRPGSKLLWGGLVFFFWPTAIVYLLRHGFRKR